MKKYKLIDNDTVQNVETGECIPIVAPGNNEARDYQDWLAKGNTPDPANIYEETWLDKRLKNIEGGGYGTVREQLEMIAEQGVDAFQAHITAIKAKYPKPN